MARDPTTRTVRMPKWGLSMQEGTITHWHVQPGDRVAAGAPFCDIETTKITNEFEAPASGIVARLLVRPDEVVPIGRPIAILAEAETEQAEIDAAVAAAAGEDDRQRRHDTSVPALRFIDAGDSRLAYLEAGDPCSESIVVFLHGFGGDHANWTMTQGALAAAGHRTVAFDLPGHGASGKNVGDGGVEAVAGIVRAGIEALGLNRIGLVAHSFGALVAARLVRHAHLTVGPVVLIAPVGFGSAPDPAYIRGFLGAERKRDMKPVMEMLFADPAALSRTIVNDALAALRQDDARRALQRIGSTLLDLRPDALRDSRDLAASDCHFVWGDRDTIVPLDGNLGESLGSRLHIVADAGHMPHIEKPTVVNGLISRFLVA